MLITVSGPAGVGKSTLAEGLADALGYDHVSGVTSFVNSRTSRASRSSSSNRLAEEDEQIDLDLDRRLRQIAEEREDLVVESRLAGWMAGDHADLKLWLDAPLSVRAARIADREDKSVDEAREETKARAGSEGAALRGVLRHRHRRPGHLRSHRQHRPLEHRRGTGPGSGCRRGLRPRVRRRKAPVDGIEYEF